MNIYPSKRKQPPTINRCYLLFYLSIRDWWLKVGLFVALISLPLLVVRLVYTAPPLWLIVFSLVAGLLAAANAVRRAWGELQDTGLSPVPVDPTVFHSFLSSMELPEELRRSGYEILSGGLVKNIISNATFKGASTFSPQLNRILWDVEPRSAPALKVTVPGHYRSTVLRTYKKWRLPMLSRSLLFTVLKKLSSRRLANAGKIRLREDILPLAPLGPLCIERTDYLSDIVTGQVTGVAFHDQQGHPFYNGYDLAFECIHGKWILKTCQSSACSNQLGVSSLVVAISPRDSADKALLRGHVFIVRQAHGNVQSPGLLAPSGSGSLDWSDFTDFGDSFVSLGMLRELFEETTKGKWQSFVDRAKTIVILTGFGRMLHRGGKPEFYGLVVMPRSSNELGIDPSEERFVEGFEQIEILPLSAQGLRQALWQYTETNADRFSHPLLSRPPLIVPISGK